MKPGFCAQVAPKFSLEESTMPYKDPEHRKEWEFRHRSQRLARRRELRRIAITRNAEQPEMPRVEDGAVSFLWLPVVGGVALASSNPHFAIGAGGLTLVAAAALKKNWIWWIAGMIILIIGLLFQWGGQKKDETR